MCQCFTCNTNSIAHPVRTRYGLSASVISGYNEFTQCGLVMPCGDGPGSTLAQVMATWTWVNTGSGDDLLPDGTKPLPESMLNYH